MTRGGWGRLAAAAGVATLTGAGVAAYAGLSYESQLFGRTFVAPQLPEEVALTFDDGPNPRVTAQLLDVLARYRVRAAFFLIGRYVRAEGPLVREIAAAGHLLGNHTETHPRLGLLPGARVEAELRACSQAIEDATGGPVRFFRPPHGERRPAVLRIARELGMETMMWNVMVGDWKPVPASVIEARLTHALARNRRGGRGSAIVLHDGGQHTPDAPRRPTVEAVDRLLIRIGATSRFVLPAANGTP